MRPADVIPLSENPDDAPQRPPAAATLSPPNESTEADVTRRDENGRPVNVRFLIALCVVLALAGVSISATHRVQMRRMADRFLAQADAAQQRGDLEQVVVNLRRYVRIAGPQPDVRARLALALAHRAETASEYGEAYAHLESVLRDLPNRSDVRAALVELTMEGGRYADALAHLQVLLRLDPENGSWLAQCGRCHEALGHTQQAIAAYEAAVQASPRLLDCYARLAELHASDSARAGEILDQMVAANRDSSAAYLIRARFALEHDNLSQALVDGRRAFQLAPRDPDVLAFVADLASLPTRSAAESAHFDRRSVRQALEAALSAQPEHPKLLATMARIHLVEGRDDEALALLKQALVNNPAELRLRWILADVLCSEGRADEAQEELTRLHQSGLATSWLAFLEGRLAMARREWLQASRRLATVAASPEVDRRLRVRAALLVADCYAALGDLRRRLDAYRLAVDLYPVSTEARLGLANALADLGRHEEALLEYARVGDQPGTAEAVARLLLVRQLHRSPEDRNWQEVSTVLDRLAQNPDSLVDALILRARMLLAQGESAKAQRLLERAIREHPGRVELRVALAHVVSRRSQGDGSIEQSLAILDQAEQELGQRVEIYLARIRLRSLEAPEAALPALEQLRAQRDRFAESDQPAIARELAAAFGQAGAYEASRQLWREVARRKPHNLLVCRRLLHLALALGDEDDARRQIASMREIEGENGVEWRLGEALRRLAQARRGVRVDLAQVLQRLEEAQNLAPHSPEISAAIAEVYQLQGKRSRALEALRNAIEQGSTDPDVMRRAVILLYEQGQTTEAMNLLDRVRGDGGLEWSGGFGRLAAGIALRSGNPSSALRYAQGAVREEDATTAERIWLAHMFWAAGQIEQAEQALRRIVAASPNEPAGWLALVQFYARTGRTDEARQTMTEAARRVGEKKTPLLLAQCHELLGEFDKAGESYRRALEHQPREALVLWSAADFALRHGQPSTAQTWLERLLRLPSATVPRAILAKARRSLASILVTRGRYPEFQKALALLERNASEFGVSAADLRIRARLLATRPTRSDRLEAVRVLLDLEDGFGLTRSDRILLARLLMETGDWSAARATFQSLLTDDANEPELLAMVLDALLDHRETTGMVPHWLSQLEQQQPDAFRTVALRVRYHVIEGRLAQATNLLRAWYTAEGLSPQETAGREAQAALLLAELARQSDRVGHTELAERLESEAEPLFRKRADSDPQGLLPWARFLGQRWKIAAAFEVLERAWKELPADQVAAVCFETLRRRSEQRYVDQTRRHLQQALRRHSDNARLTFYAASVAQLAGDFDQAESLYRRTLELDESFTPAYNELALLITLRGGDANEALRWINRAIELSGPLPYLLDSRASVLTALGRLDEAQTDLEAALDDAATPVRLFHLARVQLERQDLHAARISFRRGVAAGLHLASVHPLERSNFRKLEQALIHSAAPQP